MSGQNQLSFDAVIVGGGLAGLALALSLDSRMRVAVLTKRADWGGASDFAQGGIAAALGDEDSIGNHIADTLRTGGGLCDESIVSIVAEEGPAAVQWLADKGVPFTRDDKGNFHLTREGGHDARRIAHVADATGRAIQSALRKRIRDAENIATLDGFLAIDLISGGRFADGENNACHGLYALDLNRGKVAAVGARFVALASGGAGKAYLYTTNPDDSTGDGIAIAYRAGCRIVNMEFVQFHPTCLYHPHAKSFLISEAVRGEGGVLRDSAGRRFMPDYDSRAELAPRDIVARAIDSEMKKSGDDCVYLDITDRPDEFIREHFPTIFRRCAELGIDIRRQPIPVVPAAHYCCGGIAADADGRADVKNLFAIGECAHSGLHGANRLASNSLLECAVFARRAARIINESNPPPLLNPPAWDESQITRAAEAVMVAHNWDELRRLMWNYVGIGRSDERLLRARRRIALIREEADDYYRRFALDRDFIELRNLVICAELIVESALSRRESRGLHHTSDCPQTDAIPRPTVLDRATAEER